MSRVRPRRVVVPGTLPGSPVIRLARPEHSGLLGMSLETLAKVEQVHLYIRVA
jgi:hypothetical protein